MTARIGVITPRLIVAGAALGARILLRTLSTASWSTARSGTSPSASKMRLSRAMSPVDLDADVK